MQEIYEPYMGRGEEDRKSYEIVRGSRRRQTSGTVSVMVDRMERGNGKDRDDGDISKQVDVRVKKFLSVYEDILKKHQFKTSITQSRKLLIFLCL